MDLVRRRLDDLRDRVVAPVLDRLGMRSPAAENLLLGTALVESWTVALAQDGGGPALGIYQMEPATHDDAIAWLARRPDTAPLVLIHRAPQPDPRAQLATNLAYATAMCRIQYWRRPEPLPAADDVAGLAAYWKRFWNTAAGRGDPDEFVRRWRLFHP